MITKKLRNKLRNFFVQTSLVTFTLILESIKVNVTKGKSEEYEDGNTEYGMQNIKARISLFICRFACLDGRRVADSYIRKSS